MDFRHADIYEYRQKYHFVTIAWNNAAEKLLGYKAEEIIGRPVTTIIPEEIAQKELQHCLSLLNAEGGFSGYESVRPRKDGRRIPVELTAVAIRDKAQNITSYALIMVDITDRKTAEAERLKKLNS
jgi:PAS domain S-box-containing protein